MTDLRQAAQQALKEMDDHMYRADTHEFYEAKEALRAALAEHDRLAGIEAIEKAAGIHVSQQAEPEQEHDTDCHLQGICQRSGYSIAPTPRKPVELTDSEVDDLTMAIRNAYPLIETPFYVWCRHFSRAVIAEYERKNGITGEQT